MEINREIKNITSAFVLEDNLTECVPYGSGHINDTYRLTYGTGKHYILQKMNRSIFTKPVELMENVSGVTAWLRKKIISISACSPRLTVCGCGLIWKTVEMWRERL